MLQKSNIFTVKYTLKSIFSILFSSNNRTFVIHTVHDAHHSFEASGRLFLATFGQKLGAEAGYHAHDLIDGAHLHDVLKLFVHVSQSELTVFELFEELLIVLQLELLDFFDEAFNVTHAQEFADKRFRLERLKVVRVLAGTDKYDRTFCCGNTKNI